MPIKLEYTGHICRRPCSTSSPHSTRASIRTQCSLPPKCSKGLVAYGYIGLILYMILTGCGLPMPEEVAIIAGAAFAAADKLDPWLTLASLLVGASWAIA